MVDGRVGYTGGFGLADYWLGDGRAENEWRESNARFEGPSVAQLQATFASGWAEATGELITGDLFFPPLAFAEVGTSRRGRAALGADDREHAGRAVSRALDHRCAAHALHLELVLRA